MFEEVTEIMLELFYDPILALPAIVLGYILVWDLRRLYKKFDTNLKKNKIDLFFIVIAISFLLWFNGITLYLAYRVLRGQGIILDYNDKSTLFNTAMFITLGGVLSITWIRGIFRKRKFWFSLFGNFLFILFMIAFILSFVDNTIEIIQTKNLVIKKGFYNPKIEGVIEIFSGFIVAILFQYLVIKCIFWFVDSKIYTDKVIRKLLEGAKKWIKKEFIAVLRKIKNTFKGFKHNKTPRKQK